MLHSSSARSAAASSNDFIVEENGINTSDPASYLPPLVGDASRSQTFYLATNRVYQTIDNGNTWTAISTDLTGSLGNFLTALAVAPSDSNTIYVGSIDGIVQVSHNVLSGSAGFARVISGLPNRSVTSLAIDAADPILAYVAFSGFSGFNGDALGHVFMTTNGGGQWNDISSNLPNIPVNAIVADPNISGTLYIGTDIGAFISTDSGTSWQPLGAGLPNVVVLSLNLRPASRVLTAVTHGRGAWDVSLGGLPALQLTDISPVASNAAPPIDITATGVGFTSQSVIQVSGTPVTPTTLNSDGTSERVDPRDGIARLRRIRHHRCQRLDSLEQPAVQRHQSSADDCVALSHQRHRRRRNRHPHRHRHQLRHQLLHQFRQHHADSVNGIDRPRR